MITPQYNDGGVAVAYLDDIVVDSGGAANIINLGNIVGRSRHDKIIFLSALRVYEDYPEFSVNYKLHQVTTQVRNAGIYDYQPELHRSQLTAIFTASLSEAYRLAFDEIQQ